MTKRIIYKNDDGGISIIIPSPEAIATFGIEAIALKDVPSPKTVYDVPTGVFVANESTGEECEVMGPRTKIYPFKIVDVSDIPTDRTFRDAWEVDEAMLTDGIGAESNEFPKEVGE